PETMSGNGIRYEKLFWYDANDNVVRTDIQNRDENGVVASNHHFTTITDYDILNYPIFVCVEKNPVNVPLDVNTCGAVDTPDFVRTKYVYDANRNRIKTLFGEARNGNQPDNTQTVEYDERDKHFRAYKAKDTSDQTVTQTDYDANGSVKRVAMGAGANP